jgi:hypothetical protein
LTWRSAIFVAASVCERVRERGAGSDAEEGADDAITDAIFGCDGVGISSLLDEIAGDICGIACFDHVA